MTMKFQASQGATVRDEQIREESGVEEEMWIWFLIY